MDQYKYLQGELTALYYVESELKDYFGENKWVSQWKKKKSKKKK
jgi:hypothetical protein